MEQDKIQIEGLDVNKKVIYEATILVDKGTIPEALSEEREQFIDKLYFLFLNIWKCWYVSILIEDDNSISLAM